MSLSDEEYANLVEAKKERRHPRELVRDIYVRATILESLLIDKGIIEKKEVDDLVALCNAKLDQTESEFYERYYKDRPAEKIADQLFGPNGIGGMFGSGF